MKSKAQHLLQKLSLTLLCFLPNSPWWPLLLPITLWTYRNDHETQECIGLPQTAAFVSSFVAPKFCWSPPAYLQSIPVYMHVFQQWLNGICQGGLLDECSRLAPITVHLTVFPQLLRFLSGICQAWWCQQGHSACEWPALIDLSDHVWGENMKHGHIPQPSTLK